jgi:hypothetical protein
MRQPDVDLLSSSNPTGLREHPYGFISSLLEDQY